MFFCKLRTKAVLVLLTVIVSNFTFLPASENTTDCISPSPLIEKSSKKERGPHGPCGPRGKHGKKGATGRVGGLGLDGIQGSNGSPGASGAQGPTGPTGPTGTLSPAYISSYTDGFVTIFPASTAIQFFAFRFLPVGITQPLPSVFTVPNTGRYLVSWTLQPSASTSVAGTSSLAVDLQINGASITPSPLALQQILPTFPLRVSISGRILVDLSAGDQLTLVATPITNPSGGNVLIVNPTISIYQTPP